MSAIVKPEISGRFLGDVMIYFILACAFLISVLPVNASDKGDPNRGKKIFQSLNCAICHINGGNQVNPERPLFGEAFLKRYPQNDNKGLEKIIREGITAKGMPQFGKDQMSDQDLADVVSYIRSLTPAKAAKPSKPNLAKQKSKSHKKS